MDDPPGTGLVARHPKAVAMLLSERVIRDAISGRISLIGIHDEISSPRFPAEMPVSYVYARLTDAHGSYALALDLVRRDDLAQGASGDIADFVADDPLKEGELVARLAEVVLPAPGSYDLRLWANGRFVHSVSLQARAVQ